MFKHILVPVDLSDRHQQALDIARALERLLPMCTQMATPHGDDPLHAGVVERQAPTLAAGGYRVLALAAGALPFHKPA